MQWSSQIDLDTLYQFNDTFVLFFVADPPYLAIRENSLGVGRYLVPKCCVREGADPPARSPPAPANCNALAQCRCFAYHFQHQSDPSILNSILDSHRAALLNVRRELCCRICGITPRTLSPGAQSSETITFLPLLSV